MKKGAEEKEGVLGLDRKTHASLNHREKSPDFNHTYLIASIGSGTVL